eukprot:jgi/Picre1/28766/NNA_004165.t1
MTNFLDSRREILENDIPTFPPDAKTIQHDREHQSEAEAIEKCCVKWLRLMPVLLSASKSDNLMHVYSEEEFEAGKRFNEEYLFTSRDDVTPSPAATLLSYLSYPYFSSEDRAAVVRSMAHLLSYDSKVPVTAFLPKDGARLSLLESCMVIVNAVNAENPSGIESLFGAACDVLCMAVSYHPTLAVLLLPETSEENLNKAPCSCTDHILKFAEKADILYSSHPRRLDKVLDVICAAITSKTLRNAAVCSGLIPSETDQNPWSIVDAPIESHFTRLAGKLLQRYCNGLGSIPLWIEMLKARQLAAISGIKALFYSFSNDGLRKTLAFEESSLIAKLVSSAGVEEVGHFQDMDSLCSDLLQKTIALDETQYSEPLISISNIFLGPVLRRSPDSLGEDELSLEPECLPKRIGSAWSKLIEECSALRLKFVFKRWPDLLPKEVELDTLVKLLGLILQDQSEKEEILKPKQDTIMRIDIWEDFVENFMVIETLNSIFDILGASDNTSTIIHEQTLRMKSMLLLASQIVTSSRQGAESLVSKGICDALISICYWLSDSLPSHGLVRDKVPSSPKPSEDTVELGGRYLEYGERFEGHEVWCNVLLLCSLLWTTLPGHRKVQSLLLRISVIMSDRLTIALAPPNGENQFLTHAYVEEGRSAIAFISTMARFEGNGLSTSQI